MQKLQFTIAIKAPASKVYRTMLGLDSIKTCEKWLKVFNPTSTFKGTWEKGTKLYFIGTDENGNPGGMVSMVEEHVPDKFVSLRHVAVMEDNQEMTEGPEIEKWAGGHENYAFEESRDVTTVTVETDTPYGHIDYFKTSWPAALQKIKEMAEE